MKFLMAIAAAVVCVGSAEAALVGSVINTNIFYTQSSADAPSVPSSYFGFYGVFQQNFGDFTSVTATRPGFPAQSLTFGNLGASLPQFFSSTPSFSNEADLRAAVPFGDWQFNATNSGTGVTDSITQSYTEDFYTSSIPALTATSFNALQNFEADRSLTLQLDPSKNLSDFGANDDSLWG